MNAALVVALTQPVVALEAQAVDALLAAVEPAVGQVWVEGVPPEPVAQGLMSVLARTEVAWAEELLSVVQERVSVSARMEMALAEALPEPAVQGQASVSARMVVAWQELPVAVSETKGSVVARS